jgi:hypothetical protein
MELGTRKHVDTVSGVSTARHYFCAIELRIGQANVRA